MYDTDYVAPQRKTYLDGLIEGKHLDGHIPRDLVLLMLGGEWPDSGMSDNWPSGFAWDRVDHFRCEDGLLVPYDGSDPLPGPDFKLTIV